MPVEKFALVNDQSQQVNLLSIGKNIIGRGNVELKGVSYVEISSPNCSVSRVQANIEICPNGDAWISDCNSTNGTFLAVHHEGNSSMADEHATEGLGICLKEKYYYQLSDGCRITFGDVGRVFKRLLMPDDKDHHCSERNDSSELQAAVHSPTEREKEGASENVAMKDTTRIGDAVPLRGPSSPVISRSVGSGSGYSSHSTEKTTGPRLSTHSEIHLPYLAKEGTTSADFSSSLDSSGPVTASSVLKNESTHPMPVGRKRLSEPQEISQKGVNQRSSAASFVAPNAKKLRLEEARQEGKKSTFLMSACVSGMDASEREEAKKVVQKFGKVVEDITKANVLIVRLPAVRTPKFIIAVGRGVPVVGIDFLKHIASEEDRTKRQALCSRENLLHHMASLSHGKTEYSSALLQASVIQRQSEMDGSVGCSPILEGHTFSLQDLPTKIKDVAREVITGCGGKVLASRGKKAPVSGADQDTIITIHDESSVAELYDGILHGNWNPLRKKNTHTKN